MSEEAEFPLPHQTKVLFGHDRVESQLLDLFRSGRQHHGLMLAGPKGIGKATLAFRLASFLLAHPDHESSEVTDARDLSIDSQSRTARLVARLAHPDLTVIRPDMFAEENRSGEIKVDHVRVAMSRLSTVADADGWRVCIIDSADEMNRFANSHELFGRGVSLGDVFTLVYPQPWRDNLIRISVGCEDDGDIIAEFDAALEKV